MDSSGEPVVTYRPTPTARSGSLALALRRCRALPFGDEGVWKSEPIEHTGESVRYQVIDLLGPVVEGRHGWEVHGANLGQRRQDAQMAEMERALADNQNERAALLQGHVGSSRDQRIGKAVGDRRCRLDAAGDDDHAAGLEGAGRERRAD